MYFCNMKYKVSIQESSLTDDFDIFIEISEPFNVSIKRKCKDQELLKMYKENPQDVDEIFEREIKDSIYSILEHLNRTQNKLN